VLTSSFLFRIRFFSVVLLTGGVGEPAVRFTCFFLFSFFSVVLLTGGVIAASAMAQVQGALELVIRRYG